MFLFEVLGERTPVAMDLHQSEEEEVQQYQNFPQKSKRTENEIIIIIKYQTESCSTTKNLLPESSTFHLTVPTEYLKSIWKRGRRRRKNFHSRDFAFNNGIFC